MDAQNAAEADQARPSVASPQRRRGSQADSKHASVLDAKSGKPSEVKSKSGALSASAALAENSAEDRDSDAETIVLPGKDGHSPSKVRKVRQEDKSESDGDASKSKSTTKATKPDADTVTARAADPPRKKRLSISAGSRLADADAHSRSKDRAGSSGLSSAPNSPTQTHRRLQHRRQRSRSDAAPLSESDSDEYTTNKPSKPSLKDKARSGDRMTSQKRKAPKNESDDEADGRKARRQRTTSVSVEAGRNPRDARTSSRSHRDARTQSHSPPPRHHRRSNSTQLTSSNGLGQKKKRLPPPLQSTEYHSDDSSASGSPHPRSTKLKSLATPSNSESHMSPAKVGPHKKHLDAHGQTLLARACAKGEYDVVKQRLAERPEDLNWADYAGNTPLQIAALNGREDIVKLLIEAGCNLDCVNYEKDTPLLDAVDNGHLEVVKLLLDAGVNPRKANVNGEEPIDRVTDETDHAAEIRTLLIAAKKKAGDRMRTSEDRHSHHDLDARDSHAPDSPRRSPAAPSGRRSTTGRATKTRNDLLYMPLDDKTLRQAAGRGDEETVARILQVKDGFDDPESMVAAARGGHDLVIQLLLGLGGANADPGPVSSLPADFATPILAAIGQENIKVVRLLLEQQGFDPTRRFKGDAYYEIARNRQGPNWKQEEDILRAKYDEYKRTHKDGAPNKSPNRKEREREEKRTKRDEARADAKRERKTLQSPSREAETKRKTGSKLDNQASKRRSESFSTYGDEETPKRGPGRPRKEEKHPVEQAPDREASPTIQHKSSKTKRAESEAAIVSSDGESVKPRRKLVSKGELRGEREKKSRVSTGKEPSSPKISRNDETVEKQKLSEKYHDRTKALKRDPSRESDSTAKRHRKSTTPDRSGDAEKDETENSAKRRRLETDAPDKKSKRSALEDKTKKTNVKGGSDEDLVKDKKSKQAQRRESDRSASSEKIKIKSEDADVAMTEAPFKEPSAEKIAEAEAARKKEEEEAARKKEEEEAARKEKKRLEEEEARRLEEEEKKAREEERLRREAEAARLREEEERMRKEEEEKKRKEEEEKKRKEEEEEERRQREEEERLHREQLEREAQEAKRQQEEEERKERERRHREEVERKRAAREAEARRLREEEERARLDKLPPLLQWLQICPNPKQSSVAEKFRYMSGVRYDTIRPAATGTAEGREQWVLNTHVALLLGEKDLDLSRYTAWERSPVSHLAKKTLWRTEWELYSLLTEKYWDIGRQLPDYYSGEDPATISFETKQKLKQAAWERFMGTSMFFVKLSELLYTVPTMPHLRKVEMAVEYRELLESEAQAVGWQAPQKWKQDPGVERFHGFAPRHKYYIGGNFVREDVPTTHSISRTPFPDARKPRRGLVQVFPDDPEYEKLCLEQGLGHLVKGQHTPDLPNGARPSAMETRLLNGTNGHGHDHIAAPSVTVNGDSH